MSRAAYLKGRSTLDRVPSCPLLSLLDEQPTLQLSDFMIDFGTAGRCLPMTHSSGSLPADRQYDAYF